MARMQPFDVVGGAYSDDTRPWSVQDTVNYIVVNAERPGGRSNKMLRDAPGMVTFCASMPESSVRGLYVAEGRLFAVVGTSLYSIGTDGLAASLGTIPGVGRCVFTHNQITNGNEVVIGNGQSGYVYDTTDGTLTQITDEGFPGFRSVDFADQYVIGVEPFGRYWFHSDLADAKSYNTLDRAEAEKAPDRIQQAIATGSDVLVLGERTGQFFYNTGEATGTFANRSGAEMDVGAASPWTACRLDNTVYWLGNDGSVYRLNGYVPQRISTHALEQAISRCNLADAYAFTFEDRGHKCYLLTFPDGRTWCFDAATQEWTRRESYGFDRWRVSALVKWGRHWIAGDFINGKLYQLDWNVKQEAGEPLERRRVTGVLHDDQNRMIVNALELVFDTGMDETSPPLPNPAVQPLSITGDLPGGYELDAGTYQYVVSGGVLPRSVAIVAGALPPGATMDANGLVTYSYTTYGSYAWTVRVTDADDSTADLEDSATVNRRVILAAKAGTGDLLFVSTDGGASWPGSATMDTGLNAEPYLLANEGGRVFAIGQAGAGRYSSDNGGAWASLSGLPAKAPLRLFWMGSEYVYIPRESSQFVYVSATGASFTARSVHGSALYIYSAGRFGQNIVLGLGSGYVQSSHDGGVTWSQHRVVITDNSVDTVTAIADGFIATIGTNAYYSATGASGTWSLRGAIGHSPTSAAFGGGRLITSSATGATRYSDDGGVTWAAGAATSSGGRESLSTDMFIYTTRFIYGGTAGKIETSTNGEAWTGHLSNDASPVRSFAQVVL